MAQRRFYRHNSKPKTQNQNVQLNSEAMKISVADLKLSEPTALLLEKNNIKNAAELCIRTEKDMYKIQTLNKRVLLELSAALKNFNLAFSPEEAKPSQAQNANGKQANSSKPQQNAKQPQGNQSGQKQNGGQSQQREPFVSVGASNNGNRRNNTKVDDGLASMRPSGKKDFLLTRSTDKPSQPKVLEPKRVKEAPLTSPLPVEEWRKIQRGGKWGFYDGMKTVIEPAYDEVFHFKDGLACVEVDEKNGYINDKGEVVIEPQYDTAFSFSEGLASVEKGGKCGYINKENEVVIPFVYDAAAPFENGFARVKQAGRWGFLSPNGEVRWK